MSFPLIVLCASLAVAPLQEPARRGRPERAPAPAAEHVATGVRFSALCHWRSEAALDAHARALLDVLEGVGEAALRAGWGAAGAPPLPVHAYASPRDLERAALPADEAVLRRERGVIVTTRSAHVALQPRLEDRVHARLGTSPLLLRRAAVEGAALLRRDAFAAPESGDEWAARAVDLALAEAGLTSRFRAVGPDDEPAVSHGRVLLGRALAAGAEPLELLVAPAAPAPAFGEDHDAGDAARLAVGAALLSGELVPSYTDDASPAGGVSGWLLAAVAPGPLLGLLDEEARGRIAALVRAAAGAPRWESSGPASALHAARRGEDGALLDPGGIVQWATRQADALLLATERIEVADYVLRGTLEPHGLESGASAQMDVAFGALDDGGAGDGDRFLCVFNTREGTWVFRRNPATGDYVQVAGNAAVRPVGGAVNTFEVRVEGDLVTVVLNGRALRPGRASGLDLRGRWGLGVHAGSAGIWRGVGWEPLGE